MIVYHLYQGHDTLAEARESKATLKSVSCITLLIFKHKCKPMVSKPMYHNYRDPCKEGMAHEQYNY